MAAKSKIINEDLTINKLKKFNLYSYYYVRSPLTTIDIHSTGLPTLTHMA